MFYSVVIPLFNKEKYILRAINSVLAQTHPEFELIVVDDGSTDTSADIVKSLNDHRIKLIQQENCGVSKARNAGLKNASAEWVAFLDADDEYEPDFLKAISCFISNNVSANLSFVGTNYFIGGKDRTAQNEDIKNGVYDYFTLFGNQKSPNNSSTTVVNKDVFLTIGGFPEGIKQFEDWIAWYKLGLSGKFGYISQPLGIYHFVEDSVARTKRDPIDFYTDAKTLPEITKAFATKIHVVKPKLRNFRKQINDFSVSISENFARDGEKLLAIKMLNQISIKSTIEIPSLKKLVRTILHLLVPQSIKKIYWRLKNSL